MDTENKDYEMIDIADNAMYDENMVYDDMAYVNIAKNVVQQEQVETQQEISQDIQQDSKQNKIVKEKKIQENETLEKTLESTKTETLQTQENKEQDNDINIDYTTLDYEVEDYHDYYDEHEIEQQKKKEQDNPLSFIKPLKQRDSLLEQDEVGLSAKERFSNEFSDIENIFTLSDKLDNTLEKQDSKKDYKELEKNKHKNFDKEKENLDRAFDNLVKIRSFADLMRALYMLDEALHEMKIKSQEPKENKTFKILKKALESGKEMSVEYATIALKAIKESKQTLDSHLQTRAKEKELQSSLKNDTLGYKTSLSEKQKQIYAERMNKNIEYINKELPSFTKHYPTTLNNAKNIVKEHTISKQHTQEKARIPYQNNTHKRKQEYYKARYKDRTWNN